MMIPTPIRALLRLEALAEFLVALVAYRHLGGTWQTFAVLFLLPDLSALGYLAGSRVGAISYNSAHSYLFAAALAAMGVLLPAPILLQLAAIAAAHVGIDRALGYGLKYATDFHDTHLGRLKAVAGRRGSHSAPVPRSA